MHVQKFVFCVITTTVCVYIQIANGFVLSWPKRGSCGPSNGFS